MNDAWILGLSTMATHLMTYISVNGFFVLIRRLGLLEKYRFKRSKAQEASFQTQLDTFKETMMGLPINAVLIALIGHKVFARFGAPALTSELPSLPQMIKSFSIAYWFNHVVFYFAHRALHSKLLYKRIHKKHHTYIGTVSVAAQHANLLEEALSNSFPTLGGCLFFGAHPLVWLVWLSWRLEQTFEAHSGYCFKDSVLHRLGLTHADEAAFHDHHHLRNRGNFGMDILDWVGGTEDDWVAVGEVDGYFDKYT